MAVAVYTSTGNKATTAVKLDKTVFNVIPENHDILKLAYTAYLANGRENLAKTKTRGQVRGGGIKPWRQKGTGRARFGSIRVPIWRGGGITFGPTGIENYKIKVPLQTKRLAIRQALSLATQEGKLSIIEDLKIKSLKTSDAAKLLKKLNADKRVLIGVDNKSIELTRAFNNIPNVKIVSAKYLNTYDLMNADSIILTVDAVKIVHEWLGEGK